MKIRLILAAVVLIISVICFITHHPIKGLFLGILAILIATPKRGGGSGHKSSGLSIQKKWWWLNNH